MLMRSDQWRNGFAFAVLALFFVVAPAGASDEAAPFGLKWGMSAKDVEATGVTLKRMEKDDGEATYIAARLPRVIADAEFVRLHFGFNDRLWRVVAATKTNENDPYGSAAKARYDELVSVLREKYGPGEEHHFVPSGYYGRPDNFVSGLYQKEVWHYTNFRTPKLSVEISIRAFSINGAAVVLFYENTALEKERGKAKKAREKDAL